jgi:hypothetical protein
MEPQGDLETQAIELMRLWGPVHVGSPAGDLLRPLPQLPLDTDEIVSAVVTPHARIKFDGNRYSVPPDVARKTVMLRASVEQVRNFYQGCEIACHQRCYERGQLVLQPEDHLAALKQRRRVRAHHVEEMFDALGQVAQAFHLQLRQRLVKTIVHLRRLLNLVRLYGPEEVLAAIAQALEYQTYDAAYVERRIIAWQADRNERQTGIDWQFSTDNARIKLKRLYPNIEMR